MNWRRVHLIWFSLMLAIAVSAALGLVGFHRRPTKVMDSWTPPSGCYPISDFLLECDDGRERWRTIEQGDQR
jgi:hypothetical protein